MTSSDETEQSDWPVVNNPTRGLRKYYREGMVEHELGKMEIALELESYKRRILELPGSSLLALQKHELASCIDTFFREQGIADEVTLWYERLLEDQRSERVVAFSPIGDGEDEDEPEG